ncbi:leukocyte receptor cluster member 1 homolog [Pieris rapae]|uniref:leukocyte receptor cluster member 1 homolog n=1 Tax=Pieris rapae TaxID=64459 RepID=UPI001E280EB3|nr:leukocyte receptor cluster member 1 homolog [Pieris rapae]
MNILPKKRWHVRTKENIARVRKDEAEAAEKERQEKKRIEQADKELRLSILKQKSKINLESLNIQTNCNNFKEVEKDLVHINLFDHIEHSNNKTNKDHDREVKEKKEEYEKQIGYLTYLGQDTNEALGKKNWYDIAPGASRFSRPEYVKDTYDKLVLKDEDGNRKKIDVDVRNGEIGWKSKQKHDPFNSFKHLRSQRDNNQKHISTKNMVKTTKNKSKHKLIPEKESNLQKLREARLKREQQEKYKAELFLSKLSGVPRNEKKDKIPKVIPKYNSQFNPEIARQNYK